MKILSSILILLILTTNSIYSQNSVQKAINNFVSDNALMYASVSFQVVDLSSGQVVASHDANRTLATASTAKLFSTATALEILGEDYQPLTRVYHDGMIDPSGVLKGNIWIRGGGDASLGSHYYYDKSNRTLFLEKWADSLLLAGIKTIEGNIIADGSEFGYEGVPDGWSWSDMGNYYGAGPSGLTIFDNMIEYSFSTPSSVGRDAKLTSMSPDIPWLIFHNYVKSSSKSGDNVYIYGGPFDRDRFANGTLPVGQSAFIVKGSLPDPERQFAFEFARILAKKGISVLGEQKTAREMNVFSTANDYAKRTLIVSNYGISIGQIIDKTNERSVNLFAEHLINLVGYVKTGDGSTSSGLRVLENYWTSKFTTTAMHVNDGSGLSRSNAISAAHFTGLLSAIQKGKNGDRFYASLPIAGKSGTMRNICKGQAGDGKIAAKSGSMTRIKSYAGYVNSSTGKKYAFALIVNNATCSSSALVDKMEVVFNAISVL